MRDLESLDVTPLLSMTPLLSFPKWFGLPDKKNLPSTFSIEYVRSWKKVNKAEPEDSGDKK